MTWTNGPWAIEGGSTSADVGRLVAWHAVNGTTGIGSPTDLRVRALDTPGGSVVVSPGTCSVPVNALGKSFQMYVGSNPTDDTIEIPATGSSGGRSDLIVARIENPITGEPWTPPLDPLNGQYIFTRRYPGVDPNTVDVAQVDPSASAITLARIDIPLSTGTITDAMIVDLRKTIATPLDAAATFTSTQHYVSPDDVLPPPPLGSGFRQSDWVDFPTDANWNVPVPTWATRVELFYTANFAYGYANIWGDLRILFDGRSPGWTNFDINWPAVTVSGLDYPVVYPDGGGARSQFVAGTTMDVLPNERGATVNVKVQGRTADDDVSGARGSIFAGNGAVGYLNITFKQDASAS